MPQHCAENEPRIERAVRGVIAGAGFSSA